MMFRDVIELVTTTTGRNAIGDVVPGNPQFRQVYANKKSIRQSEFYQAAMAGLKPEIMFEIRTIDYAGERQLVYAGKTYDIKRTFGNDRELMELICFGAVGE